MKKFLTALTALVLAVCILLPSPSHSQGRAAQGKFRRVAHAVPGQYVVVLNDNAVGRGGVAPVAQALAQAHGGQVLFVYESALKGFAVRLPEAAAQALSRDPRVKFVEEDAQGELAATQFSPPNWGLDRIDQRDRPVDGQYNYNSSGTGVWVYVIDTGILSSHADFGGRSWLAADYIHDGCEDCNGHGTHVAGIIGSATYGVAKNSYPLAVKVCNSAGQCNASTVIAGINYVTQFHQNWPTIPSVANISLRFAPNTSMDQAVRNSLAAGVTYTIAAGNETQNAANNSPARVAEALTVGASDYNDQRAYFSNF
ncbi:MAG TPA: S8 family peptidase, partial [Pyrinomonadaceae bacterium]|nr:S8 family peptidase [Pyrinomonadaceae bacterium]